jgi:hypothetical protein
MLVAAMTLGGFALAAYQYARHGIPGVEAAAIALATCGLSSLSALIIAGRLRGTPFAVAAQLGGSLLRTMPPLAVVLILQRLVPGLAAAGLFGCMLASFLFSLLIETVLLVRLVHSPASGSPTSSSSTSGSSTNSGGQAGPGGPLAVA